MNHVTTCLANADGICLPDGHACAEACLALGATPPSDGTALTAGAAQVHAAAARLGIGPARYERYAAWRWGKGWHSHADGRRQALDEMERYRNDPEGFLDKIDTYLRLKDWSEREQGG